MATTLEHRLEVIEEILREHGWLEKPAAPPPVPVIPEVVPVVTEWFDTTVGFTVCYYNWKCECGGENSDVENVRNSNPQGFKLGPKVCTHCAAATIVGPFPIRSLADKLAARRI